MMNSMIDFAQERQKAIDWAYATIYGEPFVVLDTETTNFPDKGGEIVQISVIGSNGYTLIDQLVKPQGEISPGAESVHHISAEMVKDKPTFDEIYPTLVSMLGGKKIIAYNVAFDRVILNNTCTRYGLEIIPARWECAMLQYAAFNGEWDSYKNSFKWKKLGEACERFKISSEGAHDALADVRMTLKLMEAMAAEKVAQELVF